MLFESNHVGVSAEYGIATLRMAFPGEPVNAFDLARLGELDAAFTAIESHSFLHTLVIRSGRPAGFCAGIRAEALASLTSAADRGHFSWCGQQVFERLARLPVTTIAVIDGPCLGAGLELALACDFRVCVARPTTHLGFPDVRRGLLPCFGGSVRLRQRLGRRATTLLETGHTLSGREAQQLGLVDRVCCERRAKIELRSFLDEHERRGARLPLVRARARVAKALCGLAAERHAFARSSFASMPPPVRPTSLNPVPPFPAVIGLMSDNEHAVRFVADALLRGARAVIAGEGDEVGWWIDVALARGFITPLEADQARARVRVTADATGFEQVGFVIADRLTPEVASVLSRRCIAATLDEDSAGNRVERHRAIVMRFANDRLELVRSPHTETDALAALAAWLTPFGFDIALIEKPTQHEWAAA